MGRKPIAITSVKDSDGDELLVALCDNGTLWSLLRAGDGGRDAAPRWDRIRDIPQEEENND